MKLSNFFLSTNASIVDCLKLFKKNHIGEAIITNKKKELLGVISESDIRNLIIQGFSKKNKINNIFNNNPIFLEAPFTNEKKIQLLSNAKFQKRKPKLIPLLDDKNIIQDLLLCNEMKLLKKKFFLKNNENKKVLIIGGGGYIGSQLTEILVKNKYKITVFDKFIYNKKSLINLTKYKNLKIVTSDTREILSLYKHIKENNIVIHLAELVGDPLCDSNHDQTYTINYLATKNICNICKDLGIDKFIYVSSCSVYGAKAENSLLKESSLLNPQSVYAKLKIFSEKAILESQTNEFRPCILRLGTVFGVSHRPRFDLVINALTANAYKNKKIFIQGGNQWRPFVHVNDVANTIKNIISKDFEKCYGEIFNISSFNMRIISIAHFLKKYIENLKINVQTKNNDKRNYKVNSNKAKRRGIFKPKFNLNKGIEELINFLKKSKNINTNNKRFINLFNADYL